MECHERLWKSWIWDLDLGLDLGLTINTQVDTSHQKENQGSFKCDSITTDYLISLLYPILSRLDTTGFFITVLCRHCLIGLSPCTAHVYLCQCSRHADRHGDPSWLGWFSSYLNIKQVESGKVLHYLSNYKRLHDVILLPLVTKCWSQNRTSKTRHSSKARHSIEVRNSSKVRNLSEARH